MKKLILFSLICLASIATRAQKDIKGAWLTKKCCEAFLQEMHGQVPFFGKNVYLCKRYGELLSSHGQEEQA